MQVHITWLHLGRTLEVLPRETLDELLGRTIDSFNAIGTEFHLSNTSENKKIERVEELTGDDDLTLVPSVEFGYSTPRSSQLLDTLIDSGVCSGRWLLHSAVASRDGAAVKYTMTKYEVNTLYESTYSKKSGYRTLFPDGSDERMSSLGDIIIRSDSYGILDLFKGYYHDPWNDNHADDAASLGADNSVEWFRGDKHAMRSHYTERFRRLKYTL